MKFDDIDKIYFLHLSDRYDREKWMYTQIDKMNFPEDKINIWWTCRRNIFNDIGKFIYNHDWYKDISKTNPNVYSNAFNCAFEHYSIIRTSYEREFNHILIFEDDVEFMVNLDIFKHFISLLPDNYGICKFNNTNWYKGFNKHYRTYLYPIPKKIINYKNPYKKIDTNKHNFMEFCSTCAYMLDRQGMKNLINKYNENFGIADHIYQNIGNIYICNWQLCKNQGANSEDKLISDISNDNSNKIYNIFNKL